jgi:hypothetical protein
MVDLSVLRKAGFFKAQAALTDEALLADLQQRLKERGYHDDDLQDAARLISTDDQKLLDIDMEADVMEGNQVYTDLLHSLARISDGHFNPADITETWESSEGPALIRFRQQDVAYSFTADYYDDWIDGSIFEQVNELMQATSDQYFYNCTGPDNEWAGQNIVLIRLTADEKALLEEHLGWEFPS